jgi:phage baseplate assembly protein V
MERYLNPLKRRINTMITRGILQISNSATKMQSLQIKTLGGMVLDKVEHWESYGLTSQPHPGSEVLILNAGGKSANAVAVAVGDRRYRMTGLAGGEVALHDDQGQTIVLYRDRVEIKTPNRVDVIAPKVVILSDNINLGGEGGAKVARVGDKVRVGSGSSAGDWPIVEGSNKVKAL